MRNAGVGLDLKTQANMIICRTEGGLDGGGTGQALRIARAYNIPIFDLAIQGMLQRLCDFVTWKEQTDRI